MGVRTFPLIEPGLAPSFTAAQLAANPPKAGTIAFNTDTGQLDISDGTGGYASTASGVWPWGSGADGDVTLTGTVTLTRDMFYNSVIIAPDAVVSTGGFLIAARTRITNLGTLQNDGAAGNNGSFASTYTGTGTNPGGSGASGATRLGGGTNGGSGGYSSNNGTSQGSGPGTAGVSRAEVVGGAGGQGGLSTNGTRRAGGARTSLTNTSNLALPYSNLGRVLNLYGTASSVSYSTLGSVWSQYYGGTGGGGGDMDTQSIFAAGLYQCGSGGGGGGIVQLSAPVIDNQGTITARGGRGGNNAGSSVTSAGGGGGGGAVIFVCNRMLNTGTRDVSGGANGTNVGSSAAAAGTAGQVITVTGV